MLPFAKYGVKKVIIGVDEYLVKCPSCESDSWADVMISSNYYHFSHVPMFPVGKEATLFCKKCGLKRYDIPFTEKLISNFNEVKHRYRNPWYTYIGGVIMGSFVLLLIFVAIEAAIGRANQP